MAGYIALVHKDEGTSYGVSFPDVPGCIAAGDTFEEAVANAAEALAGHFALMKADGDVIPAPRTFEQLRHDAEFVEDSADAIVTMVTPRTEMAAAEQGDRQRERLFRAPCRHMRRVCRFGSSTLRAPSAPTTGKPAGSSRPSCTSTLA